jgi:hypothetical protein
VLPLSRWLVPLERSGLLAERHLSRSTAEVGGRLWERLRLGPFATPAEARAARARLGPDFAGAWIDREGAGAWALQLAALPLDEGLRSLTRLELLPRHRLYRSTLEEDGETWERLRLGFFDTHAEAERVLHELAPGYPDARVAAVGAPERAAALGAPPLLP